MSGGTIAAAVIGAAATVYAANKNSRAQKAAADRQAKAQQQALDQQTEQFNKQNSKTVDADSILDANTTSDTGSTLLSGAQGVGSDQYSLGKSSLLGW